MPAETRASLPLVELKPCPKGYSLDSDKSVSPAETVERVLGVLGASGRDILRETRRVDRGRLGIPVYLSVCGEDARAVMPTRKQMGKGASPEQARASALMELMERYAFFSFWERSPHFVEASYSEALERFSGECLPISEICRSVRDGIDEERALALMDLVRWRFYPATRLGDGRRVWLPLDWFRLLSEFNGSSSGNRAEESLLQGLSELVERHVCCLVDRERGPRPTIAPASCLDPVLAGLLRKFQDAGVRLILKDFSLGMPLPTVGALAWDPETLGVSSEIVFTAGTASSPVKAAVRAVTEVAQLGGDFCTRACYEASGLPKFSALEEAAWLFEGESVALSSLPSLESRDMREELLSAVRGLKPLEVYAVETTNPELGIPAHYLMVPGLAFRERDRNESVGLFVGRRVAEGQEPEEAGLPLARLAELCPGAHYLPFFQGRLAQRRGAQEDAARLYQAALPLQPDESSQALAAFYAGYSLSLSGDWKDAEPHFRRAMELGPGTREYSNYLGVSLFRQGRFEEAAEAFRASLAVDKGSVMDLANLGLCELRLGRLGEARERLKAALELDPGLDFARKALAELEAGER